MRSAGQRKILRSALLSGMLITALLFCAPRPVQAQQAGLEEVVAAAAQILYHNEGSYNSVNPNDNGAVSVGKLQWHGWRALALLQTITSANELQAQEMLGDTLYQEIIGTEDTAKWSTRKFTSKEASAVKNLLATEESKAAQDVLAVKDITDYIQQGQRLGMINEPALVYFADLANQGGSGAAGRVAASASRFTGSYELVTLNELHEAAICDSVMGAYQTRRFETYQYAAGLGWIYCSQADSYIPYDYVSARDYGSAWVQQSLNKCMNTSLAVTGTYDDMTKAAVTSFQTANHLAVDGYAGKDTIGALIKAVFKGTAIQNPGTSIPNPGTSTQNPGTSVQDPDTPVENPGSSIQNPGITITDPNTPSQNPGTTGSNTGTTGSNTGTAGPNAGTTGSNTGTTGSNPGTTGSNTGTAGQNPGTTGSNTGTAGQNPDTEKPQTPQLTKTILKTAKASYAVNDTHEGFMLEVTSSHQEEPLTYRSLESAVCTVDTQGMVKITGAGSTQIMVKQRETDTYEAAELSIPITVYSTDPASYPKPTGALYAEKNMKKPHVQWLQAALISLDGANITVNGSWTKTMTKIVTDFQKKCGIAADGIVGDQTQQMLKQMLAVKAKQPETTIQCSAKANTVSWKKYTKANRVYVYRKERGGDYKRLKTITNMKKTSFQDKTAKPGATYYYVVKYAIQQNKVLIKSPSSKGVTGIRK